MSERRHPVPESAMAASRLTRFADAINRTLEPLYRWVGYVGAAVLGLLIIAMVYSIIGRRFFGSPLPGSTDIIQMSLLVMVSLAIGIEHMGHEKMTVDVLVARFPGKVRGVIGIIIFSLSIIILSVAVWQLIAWGMKIQGRGETTPGTLALPKFIFAYLAAWGVFTLIPIYIGRLLKTIDKVVNR